MPSVSFFSAVTRPDLKREKSRKDSRCIVMRIRSQAWRIGSERACVWAILEWCCTLVCRVFSETWTWCLIALRMFFACWKRVIAWLIPSQREWSVTGCHSRRESPRSHVFPLVEVAKHVVRIKLPRWRKCGKDHLKLSIEDHDDAIGVYFLCPLLKGCVTYRRSPTLWCFTRFLRRMSM